MLADFLRAGGWSMWLVLLLTSILLVTAGRFVLDPRPARLAVIRALTLTQVFAIAMGVSANFMKVMFTVTSREEFAESPELHLVILYGLGEAVTPAVLGFTSLALAWMFVAVGTRRRHANDYEVTQEPPHEKDS
jgi:hypothetical protein